MKFAPSLGVLVLGAGVALVLAERRRPLRRRVEEPNRHDLRNLAIAGLSGAVVAYLQRPLVEPLARHAERRGWGLLGRLRLPQGGRTVASLLLMDYTLYLWHVLTHRAPLLWRFHAAHHSDRDLTATTALRFHFAEMALSVPYRALQVAVLGVGPRDLRLWQDLTLGCILFHHSDLRLPEAVDRAIGWVLATPRMHGIHHSVARDERDSNWSSGLSVWDRLHGTLRRDLPPAAITTGVPGLSDPEHARLPAVLAGPFTAAYGVSARAALAAAG